MLMLANVSFKLSVTRGTRQKDLDGWSEGTRYPALLTASLLGRRIAMRRQF